jgi:myosin heavy subunit
MSNINEIVNKLAKKFNFDIKEAMDHLNVLVADVAERESVASSSGTKTKLSPIDQCRKNIALWEKKQSANKFKDDEAKNKHQAKLDKEKAKLAKLEGVKVIKTEPAAKAEPKAEAKADAKRISRMSPTLKTALRKALATAGQSFTDDEWKASKKPEEFKNYVNSLSSEAESAKALEKHMEDFAAPSTEAEAEVQAAVEPAESSEPQMITIKELRAIKKLTATSAPGEFWDGDKGRFVKGPAEDTSEDMVELKIKTQVPHGGAGSDKPKFEMLDHVVGEKTKRLYRCGENDAPDQFVGYIGFGEFKNVEDPTL